MDFPSPALPLSSATIPRPHPLRSAANEVDMEAQVDAFMKRQAELESGGERGVNAWEPRTHVNRTHRTSRVSGR